MRDRLQQMEQWLNGLGYQNYRLSSASEDASFRSYQRLQMGLESWVVMDAPPDQEPCDSFIDIATRLRRAGLSAPEVIAQNLEQGFLLITDFGATPYLCALDADSEGALYADALAALLQIQIKVSSSNLPAYDEALLLQEMDLFHDWFLGELLGIELNQSQKNQWHSIQEILVQNAFDQPQLFVHRDYHSRNLMKIDQGNPGIIDFQDAVKGPITYDLVSLLRDCYIDWPVARVEQLAFEYYRVATDRALIDVGADQFLNWFNLMGLQRHLKAIGIFSRLSIRDGKNGYLKDIPRTLNYLSQVSANEQSMAGLSSLIAELDLNKRIKAIIE
ncbi:MAG: aminoglycoside/choline kinase family phosphotransferase [Gammaproteobacteria bacterium]|jgi:aminoglycoside/choline kinase family phosphotransferase